MRGRLFLPALLLAVALTAAACGSKKTSAPVTTTAPATTVPATTTAPSASTMPLTVFKVEHGVVVPTTVHVPETQAVANAALKALGFDARATISGGTATVDLGQATPAETASIVYTLTQFPTVKRVDVAGKHGLTRASLAQFAPLILIDSPAAGADVPPTIRVLGTAEVFEATLVVQLVQGGQVVDEHTVTASAGAPQRGVFATHLLAPNAGAATIVAYSPSAENGSHQHEVRVPVTVVP